MALEALNKGTPREHGVGHATQKWATFGDKRLLGSF